MIKKLKYILSIIIIASQLASCGASDAPYEKYSYEFFGTFDTIIQISGYTQSQREFDKYSSYAYKRFNELHKLYDNYETYDGINNIKTINDNAGIKPVKVDAPIIDLIAFCSRAGANLSDKTDISIGAVLQVWHNYREAGLDDPENAALPTLDELRAADAYTGMNNITVDTQAGTVYLNAGTKLDLGAVAKGYATEIIANELYDMGFKSFLIASGGNVKAVGSPMDEERPYWSIGLQNPFYFEDQENNGNLIDIAYAADISVVTSGDYQRFYEVDGVKYHHLIDPVTLFPAGNFSAVTIFTPSSAIADFLSTAMFLSSYEEGRELIESLEGVEACWIFPDGEILATDGAKAMLKNLGGAQNAVE
jgi:thiamine biosynthesis lipoprotein